MKMLESKANFTSDSVLPVDSSQVSSRNEILLHIQSLRGHIWKNVSFILFTASSGQLFSLSYHGVLAQIIVGATGNRVQLHEVVEVADFSMDPFLPSRYILSYQVSLESIFHLNALNIQTVSIIITPQVWR